MVYEIGHAQAASGNEVAVFALSRKPSIAPEGVTLRTYREASLPLLLRGRLVNDVIRWNPDIVHLHSMYVPQNVVVARALRRHGIPYVVTPHGASSPNVTRRGRLKKELYRRLFELPLWRSAAFVHAVGDAADIRTYDPKAKIISATNGVDASRFPTGLDPSVVFARYPQLRGKRILVFVGRLDPEHKGLDLLVTAMHQVADRCPSLAAVLVGPDWHGASRSLVTLIRSLDMTDRVVLWGPAFDAEKFSILAAAHTFVQPSRWEGLSLSVLEALAFGKYCLVTPAADPEGIVQAFDLGEIVEPTAASISEALIRVDGLRTEEAELIGARGRAVVKDRFSWRRSADTLVAAYSNFAAGGAASLLGVRQPCAATADLLAEELHTIGRR